jgi:site-specific DNA-methyltransferase (adenine-specific)
MHGTLYVHLDWRAAHYVRIQLDTIFGAENFLNEIIWHYRTGGVARQWFSRKHDTILVYARKLGRHRFHQIREGRFRTDGLNYDESGRPYKTTKKGRLYFHADGPALTDVWDLPFLSTVSRERERWPTQKPLALARRIISASSRPGDLVADFFCGSGTTLVAAKEMGRRYLGCDSSRPATVIARRRLNETSTKGRAGLG